MTCVCNMWRLYICFVFLGLIGVTKQVSTKVDFGMDEPISEVKTEQNENEAVEVKHTIVVSTKVKNNNRRELHSDDEADSLTYKHGKRNGNDNDSGEVPIVKVYKSVETTQIRTPDTRSKPTTDVYPGVILQSRNFRDEYDLYPNLGTNSMQWKPSPFLNNINWWNQDQAYLDSRRRPDYPKYNRRISDDGAREFYCRKCREMNGLRGCVQQRRNLWIQESTTPKIKVDGKIAKLN